jgi:hypothetical protein
MKDDLLSIIGNAFIPPQGIHRPHKRCAYLPHGFADLGRKNESVQGENATATNVTGSRLDQQAVK